MPSAPRAKPKPAVPDEALAGRLKELLESGFYVGKVPLFVIGAGVSNGRVPFITQMAERLVALISDSTEIQESVKAILIQQGNAIQAETASRSDAAEFFSTCQNGRPPDGLSSVWLRFCQELAVDGMPTSPGKFTGLFKLEAQTPSADGQDSFSGPSIAHLAIASFLTVGACHVLNLNYDPLLLLAMSSLRSSSSLHPIPVSYHLIPLHTAGDIRAYYSSPSTEYQPSIVNARGDIFYARCTNTRCPEFAKDRSLDSRFVTTRDDKKDFLCTSCHLEDIRLQLSFPGYETKERLVQPVLSQLREFLGFRTSIIIPIGLSGKWDPYLLSALFEWSLAYRVPVIDVKPDRPSVPVPTPFDAFRRRYFPSIPNSLTDDGPFYKQWTSTADEFMTWLHATVVDTRSYTTLPEIHNRVAKQTLLALR